MSQRFLSLNYVQKKVVQEFVWLFPVCLFSNKSEMNTTVLL